MISVCIPTYNGEKYIKEQLDSILKQLDANDEVIVSDDSSTDRTVQIVKQINDPRIRLLLNNRYGSATYNLENALVHSKGDIVFISDQDDVWVDNKVSITTKLLNKYECVVSDAVVVDQDLVPQYDSYYALRHSGEGLIKNIWKNTYMGCCMAFKREILEKALPFPKDIPMHDCWIGLIAEIYGSVYFTDEKLILHRRHGRNASDTAGKSTASFKKKITDRIALIRNLSRRVQQLKKEG